MSILEKLNLSKLKQFFTKWLEQHALGDDLGSEIGAGEMSRLQEWLDVHSLSECLPYQTYNDELGLYHMEETIGFLLEADPMNGASIDDDATIYSFLQEQLPEGAIFCVKNFASPRIGDNIDEFQNSRAGMGNVLETMAKSRAEYFKKGAFSSLLKTQDYLFRDYKLYIWVLFPKEIELTEENIVDFKETIVKGLSNLKISTNNVEPDAFLQLLDLLLCPRNALYKEDLRWDPLKPLNEQVGSSPMQHRVSSKKICFNDEGWEIHTFFVQKFPGTPIFLPETRDYLGNLFDDQANFPCPYSIDFMVEIIPQEWVGKIISVRADRAKTRARHQGNKSNKSIKEEHAWRDIVEKSESEERVVDGVFCITVYCRSNDIGKIKSRIDKIYKKRGKIIHVKPNYFFQLPMLLASLPLAQSNSLFKVLRKIKRTQRMWAENAANMFPMLGEPKGHCSRQLILGQRLGQILHFDNFSSNTNFNACIVGDSGSGKSVLGNELINSTLALDGAVFMIDLGDSYRKQCIALNGTYIAFKGANFSINPFTYVDFNNKNELENFIEFMVPLICAMADPLENTLDAYHNNVIWQAVSFVIEKKANAGELQDVIDYLNADSDHKSHEVARLLQKYAKLDKKTGRPGEYAHFFNGKADLDFKNRFVVFELEGVSDFLKPAILKILMYMVTIKMYLGDRKRRITLVIDEAYDTLESKSGAKIAKSVAKRARKYNGALIALSQTLSDFIDTQAGKAIFSQCHWLLMMKQKKTNIDRAIAEKSINLDPFQEKLMYSVRSIKGDFSEVLILGGDGESALGRLILDPYSLAMYSTQASDYTYLDNELTKGISMEKAIWNLAIAKYDLNGEYYRAA